MFIILMIIIPPFQLAAKDFWRSANLVSLKKLIQFVVKSALLHRQ